MQESVFAGTDARDEYELCAALGAQAEARLRQHRESYITHDDFDWLARHEINAVRIPLGYWLLDGEEPFLAGAGVLDQALHWCEEFNLMVVLDLHGLPGGQSGEHHTGRAGQFQWHRRDSHRHRSLEIVEALAARYTGFACVRAFAVVNEPAPEVPAEILDRYYRDAYLRIRRFMPAARVAVVLPAFTEQRLPMFHGRYSASEFENIITDVHYYQCFGDWYGRLDLERQIAFPLTDRLPRFRRQAPGAR